MDDNFYYRSMRKRYFQLARSRQLAYLEVHVKVKVDVALERNESRGEAKVPEAVIKRMAQKLEQPLGNHFQYFNENTLQDLLGAIERA